MNIFFIARSPSDTIFGQPTFWFYTTLILVYITIEVITLYKKLFEDAPFSVFLLANLAFIIISYMITIILGVMIDNINKWYIVVIAVICAFTAIKYVVYNTWVKK